MKGVITVGLGIGALMVLGASAASAQPQGNLQQKCINKINKDMIKVQAAQGKLNAGCVKDAVKTGSNAEACIAADAKGKVSGKEDKTVSDEMKNCVGLSPAPAFAYTSAVMANTAAEEAEDDLIHDVFGSPAIDPGLFLCDTSPAECLCQRQVIDRAEKLFRAMSKYFVKCKKAALAIGKLPAFPLGAASASDIARCVTDATIGLSVQADTKGKVADATSQMEATRANFCTVGGEFNAGVCTGSGSGVTDCLAKRTKCRFCEMVNAGDGLAIDCSTFSGTTCP
jgi:hypothetical protein